MKSLSARKCVGLFFAILLASALPMSAFAQLAIQVFEAPRGGSSQFDLYHGDRGSLQEHFDLVLDGPTSAAVKAARLVDLINARFPGAATLGAATATSVAINLSSPLITGVRYGDDETGERHRVTKSTTPPPPSPPPIPPPKKTEGWVDFHGFNSELLNGLDEHGNESVFRASLGFDSIVIDASFSFSQLTGNTIDDLLADIYHAFLADLPSIYAANLSLDLLNDEIHFEFPDAGAAGFVDSYTSDINAYATLALLTTSIPEPTTTVLLALGLLGMRYAKRRPG